MLNGRFLNDSAVRLADRLKREAGDDDSAQVRLALRLVAGREPSEAEVARGVGLIRSLEAENGIKPGDGLRAFCLVALNLNEFLYID